MKRSLAWQIGGAVLVMTALLPGCVFQDKDPSVLAGDPGPGDLVGRDAPDDGVQGDVDAGDIVADPGGDTVVDIADDGVEEDVGPDCGQRICIDCSCTCSDGRFLPYGGCFDDCNPPPPVLDGCSADCLSMCGIVAPRECTYEGVPGDCDPGQACVRVPCPHCGMQPPAYCVKVWCEGSGCYLDEHCGEGTRCYGAYIPGGQEGNCLAPPVAAAGCWTDPECPTGALCFGSSFCPPCSACAAIDREGVCGLPEGQESIVLWVPGSLFSPGETIPVAWYDFTATDIYLAGCSSYTVERKDASTGDWIDQGPPVMCGVEGVAHHVVAGQGYRDFPWTAPTDMGAFPTYRMRGQYWTGCLPDRPISSAQCTAGPIDIYSATFNVGVAP
jgi:hypothetical protein